MRAESENADQPGTIEVSVDVASHGMIRLVTSTAASLSIQAGLSPWDADRLAHQLADAARRAREILSSN